MSAKRILIFNVNWLGDVLFSTAAIRNIRYNYPDSHIACVVPARCLPVINGNPHLNEIIVFDEKGRHRNVIKKLQFVQSLKSKKFDIVFLLHRSLTRALICRLAGINERVGYYTKKRGFLLTKKIIPPTKDSMHRIDYYLNIIDKAGLNVKDRFTEFFFSERDLRSSEDFLRKHSLDRSDFLVGINPGGNWGPKRWPREYWAILADKLIEGFNAKVIITGSSQDLALADGISNLMKSKPIIASGALNIKQFAALCKRLDIFISADTGPLHIANAVGVKKLIALFGPTLPAITGPYPPTNTIVIQKANDCKIPCYIVECEDNRCMKAITPDDVVEQVMILKKQAC